MSVTFLSGVVRNRKLVHVGTSFLSASPTNQNSQPVPNIPANNTASTQNIANPSNLSSTSSRPNTNPILTHVFSDQYISQNNEYDPNLNVFSLSPYQSLYNSLTQLFSTPFIICTSLCRNFKLRVHKFTFQWDLVLHFVLSISSLLPFIFTGRRGYVNQ